MSGVIINLVTIFICILIWMTYFFSDHDYNNQCCLWNKTLKSSPSGVLHGFVQSPRFCYNLETQFLFSIILYEMFLVTSRELLSVCVCVRLRMCIFVLCVLIDPTALPVDLCSWVQSLPWMWFSISGLKWVCENIKYNVNKSSYECERYYVSLHDWVSYLCLLLQSTC